MSCLHLLSLSSASGLPRQAGRTFAPGDGLLLLGDGVYCLRQPRELAALTDNIKLYALGPDLRARGLEVRDLEAQDFEARPAKESPGASATILDYDGFVALCAEYDKTLSWF